MAILQRDMEDFHLKAGPVANLFATRAGYLQATLQLRGGLQEDEPFMLLLANHISVDTASMEGATTSYTCKFLVSSRLQSSVEYSFDHFADEVAQLVAQLKERAVWRRSSREVFILQPKLGKPRTAYLTFRAESKWSNETIERTLKKVTTVSSRRPSRLGFDFAFEAGYSRTFIILLPEWATLDEMKNILGKYFK